MLTMSMMSLSHLPVPTWMLAQAPCSSGRVLLCCGVATEGRKGLPKPCRQVLTNAAGGTPSPAGLVCQGLCFKPCVSCGTRHSPVAQDAVRGDCGDVARVIQQHGGKVYLEEEQELVPLESTSLYM